MKDSVWAMVISSCLLYPLSHTHTLSLSLSLSLTHTSVSSIQERHKEKWKWDLIRRIIWGWNLCKSWSCFSTAFLNFFFCLSSKINSIEAQESCGRTWLIQAFVGAATSLETRSHSLFSQTLQFKAAFANPILSAWIMVRIIRILI